MTEKQSGNTYVTLSICIPAYQMITVKRTDTINQNDAILKPIASATLCKHAAYEGLICSPLAKFTRILDSRFKNDILVDGDVLHSFVSLPDPSS